MRHGRGICRPFPIPYPQSTPSHQTANRTRKSWTTRSSHLRNGKDGTMAMLSNGVIGSRSARCKFSSPAEEHINSEEPKHYSTSAVCTNSEARWRRDATKEPGHLDPQIGTYWTDAPTTCSGPVNACCEFGYVRARYDVSSTFCQE